MKIAFTFLTFGKNIFAGMENSLYQLCKGINENGHQAVVFTSFKYGKERIIDGIVVYRSKFLPTDYSGGDSALKNRILENRNSIKSDLLNFIQKEKPDCIISWDPLWGFIQYLDIKNAIATPILLFFRVVNSARILQGVKKFPFAKYFALSAFLKNEILKKGITSRIEVVANSICYRPTADKSGHAKRQKIILCNARLSPEKGIPYAVKAFAKVVKRHPEFKLWLCSGEYPFGDVNKTKHRIVKLIQKLGIEREVLFLPNIKWNRVPGIIRKAYISVLPSLAETFGRSALEALAVGTPIIATKVGNLSNLVGLNGILVEPRSVEQIYNSLVQLIEDNKLYNYYLNKGKKRAKAFDRKIIAKRFIKSLKTV